MTDRAFEEGWYQFGTSLKRTFILLIMANNLECKLTAVEKFNLSLPSFMTVKFIFELLLICHEVIKHSKNVD